MSKIEIQGEGIYILLQLLDEETASTYASKGQDKGQLTSNEYDNFMDESDGGMELDFMGAHKSQLMVLK